MPSHLELKRSARRGDAKRGPQQRGSQRASIDGVRSGRTPIRRPLIIAIDGPAGSGKSSTAKALAKRMGLPYIDTGAMYRALTLKAMRGKIRFSDKRKLLGLSKTAKIELKGRIPEQQQVYLDGKNVTKAIRTPEVTKSVFYVAREPLIRREMVKKQRAMGAMAGAVIEGRDIGTAVFPKADFKFYFTASKTIRARRRHRDLQEAGRNMAIGKVLKDIVKRDKTDFSRKEGPLKCAKDAIRLNTTSLTIGQTVDKILKIARR